VLGRQLPSRARRFILRPDAVHRQLSLGQVPARPKESFNGKPSGKKVLTPPWGMRPQSMKLTRLRLLGFKSFVEPTDFMIEPGLTGVVGPNGCGKSNLVEALRWVMGESSYKSMRASSMDDVIFSGSNTRPARNNAEVAIAVDNSTRSAPAAFNDQDSLEIARRIERDAG